MTDNNIQPSNVDSDALKYILSMPQGRKVIWDILAIAGLNRQPRVAGDTEGTAFNCGALNVGLALYADCLIVEPGLTAMMIKEQGNADRKLPEPEPGTSRQPDTGSTDLGAEQDPGLGFSRYPAPGPGRD